MTKIINENIINEISEEEQKQTLHQAVSEEFPSPLELPEEIVNQNRNFNAWITIGRDRPAGIKSGFGQFSLKRNGDKCSSIDIVAGRYSYNAGKEGYKKADLKGNNVQEDASRIYISQKTNVDENFLISKAGTLKSSFNKAAIAMKSDVVRIIGRENVKIVATTGEKNSLGAIDLTAKQLRGIQLITGPETKPEEVQGIVKSENLRECINYLVEQVDSLAGILNDYIMFQDEFNNYISVHDHKGVFNSVFAGSVDVKQNLNLHSDYKNNFNQIFSKSMRSIDSIRKKLTISLPNQYLSKDTNANSYIGSIYNKTN